MPHTPEQKKAHRDYFRAHPEEIPSEKHGTISGWQYFGCQCNTCLEHKSSYRKASRQRRLQAATPASVHGTSTGYQQYGCRCERCKYAVSDVYFKTKAVPLKYSKHRGYPSWRPTLGQRDLIEAAREAFLADTGYSIAIAQAASNIKAKQKP